MYFANGEAVDDLLLVYRVSRYKFVETELVFMRQLYQEIRT